MTALDRAEKLAELNSIGEMSLRQEVAVARLMELLADEDAEVRGEAAAAAWSYPGEEPLAARLQELAGDDPAAAVRLQALGALGRIVREGDLAGAEEPGYAPEAELGQPLAATYAAVKALLLGVLDDAARPAAERHQSLESLAFLAHEERVVAGIEALRGEDVAAALRCMGRSGDPRWGDAIQDELEASAQEVAVQAIRAAGEVELTAAAPFLGRIVKGSRQPRALRIAAAAALARLGGENAAPALLEVAESDADDAVQEAARGALEELSLLSEAGAGDGPEAPDEGKAA